MTEEIATENTKDKKVNSILIDYLHPNDCLIFYGLIKRALNVCQPEIYRNPKIPNYTLSKNRLKEKLISEFSRSEFLNTNKENGSLDKSIFLIFDDIFISGANTDRFEKLDEINSKVTSGLYFIEDIPPNVFNFEWDKIVLQDKFYFTFLEARVYSDFFEPKSELLLKIENDFQQLYNMRIGYFPDFLQKKIEDEYYKCAVNAANGMVLLEEYNQLKKKIKKLLQLPRLRSHKESQELKKYDALTYSLIKELQHQPENLLDFDRKNIKGKDYFLSNIKHINRFLITFSKKNKLEKYC